MTHSSSTKVIRRPRTAREVQILDQGDTVDYAMTVEYRHPRKGTYWIKAGASTTIRSGETAHTAKARVIDFVTETLDEAVKEVME